MRDVPVSLRFILQTLASSQTAARTTGPPSPGVDNHASKAFNSGSEMSNYYYHYSSHLIYLLCISHHVWLSAYSIVKLWHGGICPKYI